MSTGKLTHAQPDYDYIITGAGAAGLSLLVRMIRSGIASQKKILLVDKEVKNKNDRTWCFWEVGTGFFEEAVFRTWPSLGFHAPGYSARFNISPYRYKMIRGIDFYQYCFALITSHSNITVHSGTVEVIHSDISGTWIIFNGQKITARYIFNSILFSKPVISKKQFYLLQHFKGWIIETAAPTFDVNEATLMDFRVGQENGTTFVYVMPLTPSRALVEYTLFSGALLSQGQYDKALDDYIKQNLGCTEYKVHSEEFGSIPMTNYKFKQRQFNIINIGTAGGQTKPSSGYTFQFIQKHTALLVERLKADGEPFIRSSESFKYRFYDSVLLNVLATGKLPGDKVFTHLFRKNPIDRIFKFLDNESSISQDLQLISSLPTAPFLKAGLQQLL